MGTRILTMAGLAIGAAGFAAFGLQRNPRLLSRLFCRRARPVMRPAAALGAPQTGLSVEPSAYPKVRRDESVVDTLHGVKVADPYRWLEDPDSEETGAFVAAQNQLTNEVLAQCDTRQAFKDLFTQLYDYPKYGTPFRRGSRYYYYYNSGLQQQYVLYSQAGLQEPAQVLLDPNTLSQDGTVALKDIEFSEDGSLLAYSLSSGGSDWAWIQVMRIQPDGSTQQLPDKLVDVKFSSIAWTHDNAGFFYNRFVRPAGVADLGTETDINTNQMLCYHVLGQPQEADALVYALPAHPTWMIGASITDDGQYLLLYVSEGCQPSNRVYYVDMKLLTERTGDGAVDWTKYDFKKGAKKLPVVKLVDEFVAAYGCVANQGSLMYFRTNLGAPRYKVVACDVRTPSPPSSWCDLIPEHPRDVLKSAVALKGDALVVRYLRDVRGALQLRSLASGSLRKEFELPGLGSITGFSGERKDSEFFFSFTSFVEPGATYRVDLEGEGLEPQLFRRTELRLQHDPDDYQTHQVFVRSKDGTQVPLFITHPRGLQLDGSNPTLLYGYGGFNISLEPGFSASRLAFMRGYRGVFAQANLRGGGEYGTQWRDAGSKENKQNVFDDFQACAEHLVSAGYCSPAKLTIQGGSNGGLLVAACANQRPDLFACVLGQVGVMDMLRFHKFTIGHAWTTDYGCADNARDLEFLLPYSPLHNVCTPLGGSRQYPAVLLATGDHDDRVVPLHSHKLIATLQHNLVVSQPETTPQRNPLLIRVEVRAGHGAGKPTAKVIDEAADLYSFAAKCMHASWVAPVTALTK
ncbi:prolyl oligopeptidase [Haematococcus lacustris]